jgi:hypothetical protein
MARFTVRLPDDLDRELQLWARTRGGRSQALRQLLQGALISGAHPPQSQAPADDVVGSSVRLTLRLTGAELAALEQEAARCGLKRTQWACALIRHRLTAQPQPTPLEARLLIAAQRDLRRIGVNLNQIARALNTAVLGGQVLALELAEITRCSEEVRGIGRELRQAILGNLAYWAGEP